MASKGKRGKQPPRRTHRDELYLLDQFSQDDLHTWRNAAASLEEYQVRLFYHLEGLRQLHNKEICNALRNGGGISQDLQGWCRIVNYFYSMEPLSARGSLSKGGRFNIGSDLDRNSQSTFPALYCAENYETAYLEKFGAPERENNSVFAGHEFALRNSSSFTVVRLNGTVNQF